MVVTLASHGYHFATRQGIEKSRLVGIPVSRTYLKGIVDRAARPGFAMRRPLSPRVAWGGAGGELPFFGIFRHGWRKI